MVKFKGLDAEEMSKLERAFSDKPNYKTKTGFTGNKKRKDEKKDWVVGKKRRKTDHLTNKERKTLASLHKQVDDIFVAASFISHKSKDKVTKREMRKGKNNNLGVEGIHGEKTFEKYKSMSNTFVKYCLEHYEIKHIGEIKVGMFHDFMEDRMKNGKENGEKYSAKTINQYKSAILKMAQEANKAGKEFENLERIADPNVEKKFNEMKVTYEVKYGRDDYKRGKNHEGKLGYSLKEAQKIAKKANEMSAYHGAMYEVLTYASPRHEELLKIKWRQIDTENNRIYLDDPNQTKTARPRFIPIPKATSQKLQALMDSDYVKNPDTRVWGSRMTQDDVYNLTKHLCKEAHVGYGGIHDFRRSSVEYHQREIMKDYEKGKISKEDLANRFMAHVEFDPKLNPIEPKKEKVRDENGKIVYVPRLNKDGSPRYTKIGKPMMQAKWDYKRDAERKIIEGPRYSKEEVMEWRIDKLVNSIVSQILGHNRTDATSPYKNG